MQKKGAKKLYVALAGAHTILPAAAIFESAGEDWCLSIFEAANYGVFLGDAARAKAIAVRIVNEATELGVEEIIISECGHAYTGHRIGRFGGQGDEKMRDLQLLPTCGQKL